MLVVSKVYFDLAKKPKLMDIDNTTEEVTIYRYSTLAFSKIVFQAFKHNNTKTAQPLSVLLHYHAAH